jgi:hypothetical protein
LVLIPKIKLVPVAKALNGERAPAGHDDAKKTKAEGIVN